MIPLVTTNGGTQPEVGVAPLRVPAEQQSNYGGIPNNDDRDHPYGGPSLQDGLSLLTAWNDQLPGIWAPDETTELLSRLENLRRSGDRYVYPGGRRPDEAAFADARLFLEKLAPLKITPRITLVADGEISFGWQSDGIYIDLGFYGDGEGGSYYAEDGSGRKYHCDSFPPESLPDEIARLICLQD